MRLATLLLAVAFVAAACSDEQLTGPATVVVANSPGTVTTNGPQRVLVALVGEGANQFLGGQDIGATIEFVAPDGSTADSVPGRWLSTEGAPLGLYVAELSFAQTGRWEVRVTGTGAEASTAVVDVFDESVVPERGDPAPRSNTPTAAGGADLTLLTTDPDPDPAFYGLSIAEAVTNGRPTVIVFATPAYCTTALCGPTLEIVKEAVVGHDGIDVVHVEPFDLDQARAGSLVPVPTMSEWQLATEPWVFVADADGVITASYEGILGQTEIEAALDEL